MASRLAGALLAEGEQATEPCIGRPIGGIDQHRHAVDEIETTADDQPHTGRLGGLMGADDAGEQLRSTIASASMPSIAAWANSSSQELAPRRNEKCEVHCNSA